MKILIADPIAEEGLKLLRKEHEVEVRLKLPPEELMQIIPDYQALMVRSETQVTAQIIAAAANLVVIGRAGVGVDNIDVAAATKKGILVLNAPQGNTIAATEHTVAMMLALARNIPQACALTRQGEWQRSKFTGVEVRGKVLGILGLGRIGTEVAKRARALDMRVVAYDPLMSEEQAQALDITLADKEEVLAAADFLTLHLPLTPDTRHVVDEAALGRVKPGLRLINCARGGVVDEAALARAIEDGRVAGAAIDVFEKEPIKLENPLLKLDKVIVTPHLGASTAEAQVGVAVDAAKGVLAALRGEPVSTAVNIPPIPEAVLRVIRPYFRLAEQMGCLAVHLTKGRLLAIDVAYNGEISSQDTRMLTTAVLKGVFNPVLTEEINYVNAPTLARERGIKVREAKDMVARDFASLLAVTVHTDRDSHRVEGTLFGKTGGRVVSIDGYRMDVEPEGWLMICPHVDQPGMVGRVGTILGEHRINITGMQVGRTDVAGTNIMAMAIAAPLAPEALRKIEALDGILGVSLVNMNAC